MVIGNMEELFSGYTFDVMDYVVQEIKTEMVNKRNEKKLDNLIKIIETLTKLKDDSKVALFWSGLANEYTIMFY